MFKIRCEQWHPSDSFLKRSWESNCPKTNWVSSKLAIENSHWVHRLRSIISSGITIKHVIALLQNVIIKCFAATGCHQRSRHVYTEDQASVT